MILGLSFGKSLSFILTNLFKCPRKPPIFGEIWTFVAKLRLRMSDFLSFWTKNLFVIGKNIKFEFLGTKESGLAKGL